jgi:hypothetical protein
MHQPKREGIHHACSSEKQHLNYVSVTAGIVHLSSCQNPVQMMGQVVLVAGKFHHFHYHL